MEYKRSIIFRIFKTVLQTAIAAVILFLLITRHQEQFKQCLEQFNYPVLLPALCCYLLHILTGAWRWRKLASLQGFNLSFFESFSLTMQGVFFSLIIPGGAIGGDVAKMGLLARRRQPGNRAEGIFTIFMDRIVGMVALFILSSVMLTLYVSKLDTLEIAGLTKTQIKLGIALLYALSFTGIFCGIAIFFHRKLQKLPGVITLMNWIDRHLNNASSRITAMADSYANSPRELSMLTLLSIAGVHIMSMSPMFFILHGAGVELNAQTILMVLSATTIGNIAGLIPITPGGIGLRDLVVISLLTAGGITSGTADTAQVMATGLSVFVSLTGGVFLLFESSAFRRQSGKSTQ